MSCENTHRKHICSEPVQHTSMQTCLSLRDESNPRPSFIRVWHELPIHRCIPHASLLGAFPSVRMTEHKLNILFN